MATGASGRRRGMPMRRRWTPDREPTASAWTAPVRAVRRLRSSNRATPDQPRHSDHNSAIVDCGLYIEGVRQEGEWGYADALATARRHRNAFVWLGLREPTEQEMTGIAR